jgi:hypothetical protein
LAFFRERCACLISTHLEAYSRKGGLPVTSEYKVDLDPAKIVKEGQVFTGETEFTVKTDKFLVEEVTVAEEPALEGKAKVVYRGEIRFNYPVNPDTLAPLVKVEDPEAAKPVGAKLETDYRNQVIGYRTEPVQKKKDERKIKLTIPGSLTPANGNAPLGEEYVKGAPLSALQERAWRSVKRTPEWIAISRVSRSQFAPRSRSSLRCRSPRPESLPRLQPPRRRFQWTPPASSAPTSHIGPGASDLATSRGQGTRR